MVEEATGRKLSLGGEVNLEIGLMPELVVTNIALANVPGGSQPQMIEIEKLQAQVRLLPLLLKDVEVHRSVFSGSRCYLRRIPTPGAIGTFSRETAPPAAPAGESRLK